MSLIAVGSLAFALNVGAKGSEPLGDIEAGREIYGRCLACHAIDYDRVGPRHCGLFGRRAGSVPGVAYSNAMKESGIVWGTETLNTFLGDPLGVVPGTFMTYAGVASPKERRQLIAWLEFATSQEQCGNRGRKQEDPTTPGSFSEMD